MDPTPEPTCPGPARRSHPDGICHPSLRQCGRKRGPLRPAPPPCSFISKSASAPDDRLAPSIASGRLVRKPSRVVIALFRAATHLRTPMQAILARLASIRIPVKRFTDPEFLSSPMRSTPGTGSQKELHRRTLTAPPHPRSGLTRGCSCSRCNPTSGWLAAARIPCQRHDNAMWCQRTGKSDLNHSGVARRRRISHSPGPRLHLGWFRKAGVNLTWHTHCARIFRTVYPLRNHAVTILVLPKQGV